MSFLYKPNSPAEATLTSLSLTHVQFNPSDPISHISAWLALLPQALVLAYSILIVTHREIEIALMFAGQLACEALNWILKRLVKEERPAAMLGKGYGMPSSHAQFMGYFAAYLVLFLLVRFRPRATPADPRPRVPAVHYLLAVCTVGSALATAGSRVYLSYHTPRQVFAGLSAGVLCGAGWWIVVGWARRDGWVDWVLDLWVAEVLRVRDLVVNEDLQTAGWERWVVERSLKRRVNARGKKRK